MRSYGSLLTASKKRWLKQRRNSEYLETGLFSSKMRMCLTLGFRQRYCRSRLMDGQMSMTLTSRRSIRDICSKLDPIFCFSGSRECASWAFWWWESRHSKQYSCIRLWETRTGRKWARAKETLSTLWTSLMELRLINWLKWSRRVRLMRKKSKRPLKRKER